MTDCIETLCNGKKIWWKNGYLHRTDGPAIEWENGTATWYIKGDWVPNRKSFQQKTGILDEEMSFLILKYGDIE